MEYLLDVEEVNSAVAILSFDETVESLIAEIEALRTSYHRRRFGVEGNEDFESLENKAYQLATLVSGPLSGVESGTRERALGVAATIFEYLMEVSDSPHKSSCYGLNAVLFYSRGEYEAQASSLAKNIANSYAQDVDTESRVLRECWRRVFLFLGRDFKQIIISTQSSDVNEFLGELSEIDENPFWRYLLEGCSRVAIYLVWGEHTAWEDSFRRAIEVSFSWGNNRLSWIALTIKEIAGDMVERSVRRLFAGTGLPDRLADVFALDSIFELWKSHRVAFGIDNIEHGLFSENARSALINVPTSAGKSLVAELAIIGFINRNADARVVWIVPSRALVNEIFSRLRKRFKRANIPVVTSIGGIELTPGENEVLGGGHVLILTPEKLDGILRRAPNVLEGPSLVVFDEMHKITEPGRGWFLESVIAWVLLKAASNQNLKMLFMSAVLPNIATFENWLSAGDQRCVTFRSRWRPTRLGLFTVSEVNYRRNFQIKLHQKQSNSIIGTYLNEDNSGAQYKIPIQFLNHLVNDDHRSKSILVFFYAKQDLNTFVGSLVRSDILNELNLPEVNSLAEKFSSIYGAEHDFTRAVRVGVGIDHGDLPIWLRGMVEEAFRRQWLRVLVANQVVLEGVNFPIDDMLICSLGTLSDRGFNYRLRKQDFVNLVGRVGRALVNTEGRCFLFKPYIYVRTDNDRHTFQTYIETEGIPDAHSSIVFDEDEFAEVLGRLSNAIEGGEEDAFNDLGRWREPLERLHSAVLGIAGTVEGERYTEMRNLVQKTLAWQESTLETRRVFTRYLRAVDNSLATNQFEEFEVAASSGLSVASARVVSSIAYQIIARWNDNRECLRPNFMNIFTQDVFEMIVQLRECYRLGPVTYGSRATRARVDHYNATVSWLQGANWEHVSEVILRNHQNLATNTKAQIVAAYVSQMFEYRLPWVLSGVALAAKELNAPEELQSFLDALPSQVRFGVDSYIGVEISKLVRGERAVALVLRDHIEETDITQRRLIQWILRITLNQLREWFPTETDSNIRRLHGELQSHRKRDCSLRTNGILRTTLVNVRQDAWAAIQLSGERRHNVHMNVDRNMENTPFAISILADIAGREMEIGFLNKNYEEEILELLEWGRQIDIRLLSRDGELCDPPRVRLCLRAAN